MISGFKPNYWKLSNYIVSKPDKQQYISNGLERLSMPRWTDKDIGGQTTTKYLHVKGKELVFHMLTDELEVWEMMYKLVDRKIWMDWVSKNFKVIKQHGTK